MNEEANKEIRSARGLRSQAVKLRNELLQELLELQSQISATAPPSSETNRIGGPFRYVNMTLTDAAVEFITEKREPQPIEAIQEALIAGGAWINRSDPAAQISRALNSTQRQIVKTEDGRFDVKRPA